MRAAGIAAVAVVVAACGPRPAPRPYAEPSPAALLEAVASIERRVSSLRAETVMDVWLGDQRLRRRVLVLARWGRHARLQVEDPSSPLPLLADLACDGERFAFVDHLNDCQRTGPCDRTAVAQLLRIDLEPDDFLRFSLGSAPLLEPADAAVRWDERRAAEIVTLTGPDGATETLALDGRDRRWDLLEATLRNPRGDTLWTARNTDHRAVGPVRLPGKTQFVQPPADSDLLIEWRSQELNVEIPDSAFRLEIPPGLPACP